MEIKVRAGRFPIDAIATKCDCGGYAERVATTPEEIKKYDCGKGRECCSRAFICCVCGMRIVGVAEAPEMN